MQVKTSQLFLNITDRNGDQKNGNDNEMVRKRL